MSSSLPGITQSRASQTRARSADPVRDATPTTPSDRSRSAAASFANLLDARLAADRAAKAAAARSETRAEHPDDDPTALALTEADLRAARLAAVAMGAGGIAATADQATDGTATGAGDTAATANAASGDPTAATTEVRTEAAAATGVAAAAAAAAGAAGPTRPTHGLDTVAPELRDRVARVVERMRDEFGLEVEVAEGYRSQARQDALHAQGRSAPGPVVTWTRDSKHTLGRAVDVTVNGGYSDMRGFATLQRVAREEGLHTLGMRDPGHLELPASVAGSSRPPVSVAAAGAMGAGGVDLAALAQLASDAGARVDSVHVDADLAPPAARPTTQPATPAPQAGVARVAAVAQVAQVANVARVARVAAAGAPATASAAGTGGTRTASRATATGRVAAAAGEGATISGASAATPTATSAQPANGATVATASAQQLAASGQPAPLARDRSAAEERAGDGRGDGSGGMEGRGMDTGTLFGGEGSRDRGGAAGAPRMMPVTGSAAADALSRLDQIDALRDGSAARPLSHLTLTLDDAAGGTDRIRVDVRGSQMGAVLELSDPVLRGRVSSHIGELQQALEQRGLQSDALQVRRAGTGAAEALDMSRIAGATLERESVRPGSNANAGQSSTQQRERDGRHPSDGPRDDSSPRQRSRREPEENQK